MSEWFWTWARKAARRIDTPDRNRNGHDREAGHGAKDESPVANGDAPND